MTIHYTDDQVTLHHGDALDVLTTLPAESVHCIVTSPPYYGLRDYGQPGQYGLEPNPGAYVDTMRTVFAEARRVLTADGTLWLNIGDSYTSTGGTTGTGPNATVGATHFAVMPAALAERCILAGARPGGIVLDPFAGSCTTGYAALKHGRRFVGIDLSATYLDLALRTRLAQGALIDEEDA